jgi:hypothetical protein
MRLGYLDSAATALGDGDSGECGVETPIFIHIFFENVELQFER